MDYALNIVSKYRFFFIFKHSRAPKRSWKSFHGVLESPRKVLDFFLSEKSGNPDISASALHESSETTLEWEQTPNHTHTDRTQISTVFSSSQFPQRISNEVSCGSDFCQNVKGIHHVAQNKYSCSLSRNWNRKTHYWCIMGLVTWRKQTTRGAVTI